MGLLNRIAIVLVILLLISCANNSEKIVLRNWNNNKNKYISLVNDTKQIFKDTDIKEITKNDITTVSGVVIGTNNIKQYYPKYSIEIYKVLAVLNELNIGIDYGNGYVSFFIVSGGVLESDYFIVYENNSNSLINFINDNEIIGYTVLSQKKITENWYLVNTD